YMVSDSCIYYFVPVRPPPRPPLFPYTTLFRSGGLAWMQGMFYGIGAAVIGIIARSAFKLTKLTIGKDKLLWSIFTVLAISTALTDRKSTRLNSSHLVISYAVFCLKKKKIDKYS